MTHFGVDDASFPGHAYDANDTLFITNDIGGNALDRAAHVRILNRRNAEVRVVGTCASACTRYLAVRNVCTSPQALWLFHPASLRGRDPAGMSGAQRFMLERLTVASYLDVEPALRRWALEITAAMGPDEQHVITGQALIKTGWLPSCGDAVTDTELHQAEETAAYLSHVQMPLRPVPHR